ESSIRFQHESVSVMFDEYGPHADKVVPFLECSRHIRRFFILENVQGCLKQSSNVSEDDPYKASVTVVSDDTNVWVNNPSKKREILENGRTADSANKHKGMKRVQSLLGMLQHVILRRSDGDGMGSQAIAQIHAPCQLLSRANSWTTLHRMRRWSLYSSVGCAPQFGGESLWNLFAAVPLKLVLHCGDALPANHVCQAAEHVRWHQRRTEGDINASTTLQTECNCLHHQAALALKPGLLSVEGLCSGMVRMTRAMRATKFQCLYQEGLDILAESVERRVVQQLPSGIQGIQAKQQRLLGILGHELLEDEQKLILSTFNSSWDDEVGADGKWVHWCNGCCVSQQDCVNRSRECLRLLFQQFPQVPLLYRWKGWGPCQNYCTRGVFVHNFVAFLIRRCCSKHSQSAVDQQAMDEDSPDLPLSLRQEIRMTKTLAFMTSGTIRADLGKSLLVYWPLATLMDFISLVETARSRAQLRIRSLALPGSQCKYSEEELRDMNWSVLGGAKGEEAVKEFTVLLLASPDEEILQACRVSFPDVLPHVFPAMCDAWRRLVLPTKKQKTRLLGMGRMNTSQAKELLIEMAKMPVCCIGDPFVQVELQITAKGENDAAVNQLRDLLQDALLHMPASSVNVEKFHANTQQTATAHRTGKTADSLQLDTYVMSTRLEHDRLKRAAQDETLGASKRRAGKLLSSRVVSRTIPGTTRGKVDGRGGGRRSTLAQLVVTNSLGM
ncbi:unnamed protein product, partial [Symbiodinium necroappetens]